MECKSYWPRVLAGCVALIILTVSALSFYAFTITSEARRILRDFYSLHVGVSTASEVKTIVDKHRRHLSSTTCEADRCWYFFEVTNGVLSQIRIEPGARFQAWLVVRDGKLEILHTEVQRDTRVFPTSPSGGIVDESLTVPDYYRRGNPHYSFPTPIGKPYLLVAIDAESRTEERRRAYAFSLSCLVKPGRGCDLPCDYLSLAWKDWESQLSSQGGFGEYYPRQSRCE